jgi:hypothetical protein
MSRDPKKDKESDEEKASVTLPGTVEKIIPAIGQIRPEQAQIAVEGAEPLYIEIRVENNMQNEAGETVRLKQGAEVEVTIEAKPEDTQPVPQAKEPATETPVKKDKKPAKQD